MKNLVPLESYLDELALDRARLGFVSGAFFGLVLTATFAALAWQSECWQRALLAAVVGGALSGVTFGYVFPRALEARLRKTTKRVYEGEGRYSAPAPDRGFTHRLPSSLVVSPTLAVGGVLYAGPSRVAFVPHAVNLPRHRAPLDIPGESLRVSLKPARTTALQRFLVPHAKERLVLSAGMQSWEFLVPTPAAVVPALEDVVAGRS